MLILVRSSSSSTILTPVLTISPPVTLKHLLDHRAVAPRTPPGSPYHTNTNTNSISDSESHPTEWWVCVWDSLCLTGIWVHAEVRRCVRTWWSTTSWLLWQHCLERWDSATAFSSPHHFSSSSSAAVTARPWYPQQFGAIPEQRYSLFVKMSAPTLGTDWLLASNSSSQLSSERG